LTWLLDHIAIFLAVALTMLAAVLILQQRRTPQSTAAWLLFILLVPYAAIPAFLALGFRKQGSRFPTIRFSSTGKDAPRPPSQLDDLFRHFGLPPASDGNAFKLLDNGESAYAAIMRLIEEAQDTLDITFYLIADDAVGQAFMEALTRKARSGVQVRLIVDRLGDLRRPRAALRNFRKAGGHLRYFSPILHAPDKGHLNLRNHRKMVIADRRRVFSGGMNVGLEYMGPTPDALRWVDLSFLLEGPVVETFLDVYRSDWGMVARNTYEPKAPALPSAVGGTVAQLVPSGPDMDGDPLHDGLVNAIHTAQRRIWICTPYFLPTELLGSALAIAGRRGIDVRILLPERSNHRIADVARGAYLRDLAEAGCRVLYFPDGMVHAKMGVIDDLAWAGSANFDVRSMLLNFETALFVYDADSVADLAAWFVAVEGRCKEAVLSSTLLRRLLEGVFRLGSPIL
jgi:cardiolipin synthase